SIIRFSPKAPGSTSAPLLRNSSIFSKERRLTWRCQFPAWASPSSPQPSLRTASPTGTLAVPLSLLIHISKSLLNLLSSDPVHVFLLCSLPPGLFKLVAGRLLPDCLPDRTGNLLFRRPLPEEPPQVRPPLILEAGL